MSAASERLGEMLRYVGFAPEDAAALRRLRPGVDRVRSRLVDEFYRRILAEPGARSVIKSEALLAGLRVSLDAWLTRLFDDAIDEIWFERRSQIGRRHVEVALPQRYMPLAMNVIREFLVALTIDECREDEDRLRRTLAAVNKILDLELTAMLDTYHDDTMLQLKQVERLATITQLAAGVSHELKNPLGVMNTSLFLLKRLLSEGGREIDASITEHLERIGRATRQASELTDQLVDYARVRAVTRQHVPIFALVDDALKMLGPPQTIEFELEGARDATVFADPVLLTRVLLNLLRNSVQAITERKGIECRGRVQIRWDVDRGFDRIEVIDDGPGVPAAIRGQVFEPLFTTRANGTGLGLAICRALVQSQGGTIELIDRVAYGATFRIRLPQNR